MFSCGFIHPPHTAHSLMIVYPFEGGTQCQNMFRRLADLTLTSPLEYRANNRTSGTISIITGPRPYCEPRLSYL